MVNIAINGYGRIGRVAHRIILEQHLHEASVVATNAGSSTDLEAWMYLLKYDTMYRPLPNFKLGIKKPEEKPLPFQTTAEFLGYLVIDSNEIPVFADRDPKNLPWRDLKVDVVIESTGAFTTEEKMKPHLESGAKSVILSAPFKDEETG